MNRSPAEVRAELHAGAVDIPFDTVDEARQLIHDLTERIRSATSVHEYMTLAQERDHVQRWLAATHRDPHLRGVIT